MKFKFRDRVEVIDECLEEFYGFRLKGEVIDFIKEEWDGYVIEFKYLVLIDNDTLSEEMWFNENKLKKLDGKGK